MMARDTHVLQPCAGGQRERCLLITLTRQMHDCKIGARCVSRDERFDGFVHRARAERTTHRDDDQSCGVNTELARHSRSFVCCVIAVPRDGANCGSHGGARVLCTWQLRTCECRGDRRRLLGLHPCCQTWVLVVAHDYDRNTECSRRAHRRLAGKTTDAHYDSWPP